MKRIAAAVAIGLLPASGIGADGPLLQAEAGDATSRH